MQDKMWNDRDLYDYVEQTKDVVLRANCRQLLADDYTSMAIEHITDFFCHRYELILKLLDADNCHFFVSIDDQDLIHFCVGVNDLFCPGADAEEIAGAELEEVWAKWQQGGYKAVVEWVAAKRGGAKFWSKEVKL